MPEMDGAAKQQEKPYAHIPLEEVIGKELTNGKIICPFHEDIRPSLHVYPDHYYCYTCKMRGDHLDWLMMVEEMPREAAIEFLDNWNGATVPPVDRAAEASDKLAKALRIWNEAKPINGTPAIEYLSKVRGIDTAALPENINNALRFHPNCAFGLGRVPCLVACFSDVGNGEFAGIHRIALTDDVFAGAKVQRQMLGSWPRPRAIKLWPAGDKLYVGEGIETVLAAATKLKHNEQPMRPAWAMATAHGLTKLPAIDGIETLVILVDNDQAGKNAAEQCRKTWRDRDVIALMPDSPGADFNDVVQKDLAWREQTNEPNEEFNGIPLTFSEWMARDLPPVDRLLGDVLTTTMRGILSANTGLGKTNLCMALAGYMAAGKDFLHWKAHRPAKVLYVDGEMSRRLLKERIKDVGRRLGVQPDNLRFMSMEDFDGFPPLNTPDGITRLKSFLDHIGGTDFIFFDNIMALIQGDQKDEVSWTAVLPLVNFLTKHHVGQLWINHTGHNAERGYGSKTKEWRMDTVIHLKAVENANVDICFNLEFRKNREKTPTNRTDFVDLEIALVNDKWVGSVAPKNRGEPSDTESKMLEAFDRLARGPEGQEYKGRQAVHNDNWQTECVDRNHAVKDANAFRSYRSRLVSKNLIECDGDMVWRI